MRNVPESCVGAYVTTLTSELIPVSPRFVELPKKTRVPGMFWVGFVARGSLRQHLCVGVRPDRWPARSGRTGRV